MSKIYLCQNHKEHIRRTESDAQRVAMLLFDFWPTSAESYCTWCQQRMMFLRPVHNPTNDELLTFLNNIWEKEFPVDTCQVADYVL